MPKPIVLMYLPPNSTAFGDGAAGVMAGMNGWGDKYNPMPEIKEYLWLVFEKYGIDAPELQVFHPKDFTEIQFEELKQLAITELQKITNKTPE